MYLLDSNAVSDLMRADAQIEDWLATLDDIDQVVVCSIVRGEILFGIQRLQPGQRRTKLELAASQFLGKFPCESIPASAGDQYAAVKRSQQRRGQALDENDLWIAATAIALNATLVSRDSDFASVAGLRVVKAVI